MGKDKESQDWEEWETIRSYKEWGFEWLPPSASEGQDLRGVLPVLPSAAVLRVKLGSSVAKSVVNKEVHHKGICLPIECLETTKEQLKMASCSSRRSKCSSGNCVD